MSVLFGVLGVSLWLGIMGMAFALPINPNIARITKRFVCPPGAEMKIETFVYPYHKPGERAIGIYAVSANGSRTSVKAKAMVALVLIFTLAALPLTIMLFKVLF
jgi:hypothetical protein